MLLPGTVRLVNAIRMLSLQNNWFCSQGSDLDWHVNDFKVIFNHPMVKAMTTLLPQTVDAV